ncbi:MAG TPA: helix-turn-helix transcriptional regulator, partial [Acidimicrobiales bacterium]|nr:helix-turn-helix transcriptional regulator [Acidimicrobiales bacterium]
MASDQGPVVQSALLRNELIRLRKESGLTQEQVASALDWSPSKLIRVEGGRSAITKVDLDALLARYGVTSESSRDRLQSLNRGARERPWWASYRDEIRATYLEYVGYETGAASIRQFMAEAIPGLLQTPEYAEVLTSNSVDAVKVAPVVKLRLQRQAELARRSGPPRQYYVIDESTIRRHVGIKQDPAIMPNQLRSLADRAEADERVTVRVMPFSAGAHVGLAGTFTLLEFDGALGDLLYFDSGRSSVLVSGDDLQIAQYADDFETLLGEALPAGESVDFIRKAAQDMSLSAGTYLAIGGENEIVYTLRGECRQGSGNSPSAPAGSTPRPGSSADIGRPPD